MPSLSCRCGLCCWGAMESLCLFNWSYLPDDIKIEILCRLPEKPLVRLKCVSKSLNILISNFCAPKKYPSSSISGFLYKWLFPKKSFKSFMRYLPYDGKDTVAVMATDADAYANSADEFVKSYSALLPFEHYGIDFQDCCNGLLLIVNTKVAPLQYFVCNPATKQSIAIPINTDHTQVESETMPEAKTLFAALAFDPFISPIYTIVCVNRAASVMASVSSPPKFDIFSSYTGKWVSHQVRLDPQLYGFKLGIRGIFLNGILYLLSMAGYLLQLKLKLNYVKGKSVKLPDRGRGFVSVGVIHVSKAQLYYSNHDLCTLNLWSLEDNCGVEAEWVVKNSISIDVLIKHPKGSSLNNFRHSLFFNTFALHPTSDDVIFIGYVWTIYAYNPKVDELVVFCQVDRASYIDQGADFLFPYSPCPVVLNDFRAEPSDNPISGEVGNEASKEEDGVEYLKHFRYS